MAFQLTPSIDLSEFETKSKISSNEAASEQKSQSYLSNVRIPEPLRRAVAECTQQQALQSNLACSSSRTLDDYLRNSSTADITYFCLMEHARAEKTRSPLVIIKCVALLKKYLFRYPPSKSASEVIKSFCDDLIIECEDFLSSKRSQNVGFASESISGIMKTLTYIRSIVLKTSPNGMAEYSATFSLNPSRNKSQTTQEILNSDNDTSNPNQSEAKKEESYIVSDMLKSRWIGKERGWAATNTSPSRSLEAMTPLSPSRAPTGHTSLASVLLCDPSMPTDQILHCHSITGVSDMSLSRAQIKDISVSRRRGIEAEMNHRKEGDFAGNSMRRRMQRPMFQYKYYSEQQPLRLSEAEMEDAVTAVTSTSLGQNFSANINSAGLRNNASPAYLNIQRDVSDVAASILVKLIIDMYLTDTPSAAPLVFTLFQSMLDLPQASSRVRPFDLLLNLGVHGHLLHPELFQHDMRLPESKMSAEPSAEVEGTHSLFESWLVMLMSEVLLYLVQVEESDEQVWSAALSCLFFYTCDRGQVLKSRIQNIDIRVITSLLAVGNEHGWAEAILTHLIRMLTSMVYCESEPADQPAAQKSPPRPALDPTKLKTIGGINYICGEFASARSVEARRNLFAILLDYVLEQERKHLSHGHSQTSRTSLEQEIASIALAFASSDCIEVLLQAVKLPEGFGESMASKILATMPSTLSSESINHVAHALSSLVSEHSSIPMEFQPLVALTLAKQWPTFTASEPGQGASPDAEEAEVEVRAWTLLKSLLHSPRPSDRKIGLNWLLMLLANQLPGNDYSQVSSGGPSDGLNSSVNPRSLLQSQRNSLESADEPSLYRQMSLSESTWKEAVAAMDGSENDAGGEGGSMARTTSEAASLAGSMSGCVQILLGLLQSSTAAVRRGYLAVLERLLATYVITREREGAMGLGLGIGLGLGLGADTNEMGESHMTLLSTSLWQMMSTNDGSRINTLHMCELLLTQLCGPCTLPTADLADLPAPFPGPPSVPGSSPLLSPSPSSPPISFFSRSIQVPRSPPTPAVAPTPLPVTQPIAEDSSSVARLFLLGRSVAARPLLAHLPPSLLLWPLLHLASPPSPPSSPSKATPPRLSPVPAQAFPSPSTAGASADSFGSPGTLLGLAVGSGGYLGAGSVSDVRAALLVLLMAKCMDSLEAMAEVGGLNFFRSLLEDADPRIAYFSSKFLLKKMISDNSHEYQSALKKLVFAAQQADNEKILENPFLQVKGLSQCMEEEADSLPPFV